MSLGTLYLLPNTLGKRDNEDPILDVLPTGVMQRIAGLSYFVVENTRTARSLLSKIREHYPLNTALQDIQFSELNVNTPATAINDLLEPLLNGQDVGLLSEAGLPAIADPGAVLVAAAHQHNIRVMPMVGPSSLLLALMGSGLNGQSFAFHGYLPIDIQERQKTIIELEKESAQKKSTQLFIETPYRNQALLEHLIQYCRPDTQLSIAVNLSLPDQRIETRTVIEWKKMGANAWAGLHKKPTVFLLLAGGKQKHNVRH
jgi:16S rRNA (cytidine1402-2'-O)-methyltransferase